MLLICRFRPAATEDLLAPAREALRLLTAQPGCTDATLAQAVDEPGAWVLVARFDSVAAYRRALSPFPVREHVVPWLSQAATDGPSSYEPRLHAVDGELTEHASLVAGDAATAPRRC